MHLFYIANHNSMGIKQIGRSDKWRHYKLINHQIRLQALSGIFRDILVIILD